ncbi:MAG: Short-chain dehydrogenase/reductase [Chthonomonadaceae bacterium]|nr:Short-chain dehydrogenase/reductase [Chthonomonadaceae bacterium]
MATVNGKIALVTGANKGIGFETARQLGKLGIKVLLGARDLAKGEAAAATLKAEGLDVTPIVLDVTDSASIKAAAQKVEAEYGKLDILVNNAGVLFETFADKPSTTSQETLRKTYDANFFGVIELTQVFLPLVLKSDAGRIVNLSSILGSLGEHSDPKSFIYDVTMLAYNSSKTALNAFTVHLARELKETPVKVNAAHPGWVKTELGGEGAPMELEDGAKTSVELATLAADGPSGGFFHLGQTLAW